MMKRTPYVTVLLVFLFVLSVGFSSAYDGFALYDKGEDSTIYMYDFNGQYRNYIPTVNLFNPDCNSADGISDVDGSTGDIFVVSECGLITKLDTNKNTIWTYQIPSNDTEDRYIKANDDHVLITGTNFTLLNNDGSLNVTRSNGYTVFNSNVELTDDSTLLIADRNIDSIIELDVIADSFVQTYSPYFIDDVFSLSYDREKENIFIVHGTVGSFDYGGDTGNIWKPTLITLINSSFDTLWTYAGDDDNTFTNYEHNDLVSYFDCDGLGYRQYATQSYAYNGKYYLIGTDEFLYGGSTCEDGFGNDRGEDAYPILSTFDEILEYPLLINQAEDHYISDYTTFMSSSKFNEQGKALHDTFHILDDPAGNPFIVTLDMGSTVNVTIGYQSGYTSFFETYDFETPYPLYTLRNIRVSKIKDIQIPSDDVIGSDVDIIGFIDDQYTALDTITLNMSEYFFNYTDIDIEFFNSNTSWIVTLDTGIGESDVYYNDSSINYSLELSGSDDLLFKIDPFSYYDGTHLNEEVVVQAYRNDSSDFAEQRFNLQVARSASEPELTGDGDVSVIGTIQNVKVPYNTTAYVTMRDVFSGANTYIVEWFDSDTGTTIFLNDDYTVANKFEDDEFSAWFASDSLGRKTFYVRSKSIDAVTSFNVIGVYIETGFGVVDEEIQDFKYTIDGTLTTTEEEEDIISQIIPDAQDYDNRGRWLWGVFIIIGLSALMYGMADGSIIMTVIGAIVGFALSVALGFIPVGVVIFAVLILIAFIYMRMRG